MASFQAVIFCWVIFWVFVGIVGMGRDLQRVDGFVEDFLYVYVNYLLKDFFVMQILNTQLGLFLGCFSLVHGELL